MYRIQRWMPLRIRVTLNSACVLNAIVRLSTAYFTWMCVSV